MQSWHATPDKLFLEHSPWRGHIACAPKGWFSDAINSVIIKQKLSIRTTNRLSQCVKLLKKGGVELISINDTFLHSSSSLESIKITQLSLCWQNITYYLVAPKKVSHLLRLSIRHGCPAHLRINGCSWLLNQSLTHFIYRIKQCFTTVSFQIKAPGK